MQIQILQSQLNKSITVTSHHSTKLQIGLITTVYTYGIYKLIVCTVFR